ncbi:hypothetical protein [Salibacterium lacus]|uniref:Uncharacterized protein n=1 Tax=Salibacterium lacus TaxID=1898109 RepID=A0ABW5T589_9BACI
MYNTILYYQMNQGQSSETIIPYMEQVISKIKELPAHIHGVFIDAPDEYKEFEELIDKPLKHIDYIYLNRQLKDPFYHTMLEQVLINESVCTKYFEL